VAADPCRQRQPKRIEHREIDLQPQQVRVMILAVAELKQSLFGHPPIVFGRRCINPHPQPTVRRGSSVIDGKWLGHTESLPQFSISTQNNERTMSY
jgi:hypothetical protein